MATTTKKYEVKEANKASTVTLNAAGYHKTGKRTIKLACATQTELEYLITVIPDAITVKTA